jgi:hypothetical protein
VWKKRFETHGSVAVPRAWLAVARFRRVDPTERFQDAPATRPSRRVCRLKVAPTAMDFVARLGISEKSPLAIFFLE